MPALVCACISSPGTGLYEQHETRRRQQLATTISWPPRSHRSCRPTAARLARLPNDRLLRRARCAISGPPIGRVKGQVLGALITLIAHLHSCFIAQASRLGCLRELCLLPQQKLPPNPELCQRVSHGGARSAVCVLILMF